MSQNNDPEGYRGELRERLIREHIRTWSKVKVKKDNAIYEGLLLLEAYTQMIIILL